MITACFHNVSREGNMGRNISYMQRVNVRGEPISTSPPNPGNYFTVPDSDEEQKGAVVKSAIKGEYWLSNYNLTALRDIIGDNDDSGFIFANVLAANELVGQIQALRNGRYIAIVNTAKWRLRGGVHWVVVVWSKEGGEQVTVQFFDSMTGSLCASLERIIKSQESWKLLPTKGMRWQEDGWRCGYFAIYAAMLYEVDADEASGVALKQMPNNFPKLVQELLRQATAWKRGDQIRLTKGERNKLTAGEQGIADVLLNRQKSICE